MWFASLNRRHKAVLFLTLVSAGAALLNRVPFKESLGLGLLGVAGAWAVGSDGFMVIWKRIRASIMDCLAFAAQLLYASLVIAGPFLLWVGFNATGNEQLEAFYLGAAFLVVSFLLYRKFGKPQLRRRSDRK